MTNKKLALYLFAISLFTLINCKQNLNEKKFPTQESVGNEKTIDSISLDLNNDEKLDKVEVICKNNSERILVVKIKAKNGYKLIASNSVIIGCLTCGYQSGDPYIGISKSAHGFQVDLEYMKLSFFCESDSIFLEETDVLKTLPNNNGIEETHEIFTYTQFGKLHLSNLKEGFESTIREQYGLNPSDCNDISIAMGTGKECIFPNIKLNDAYNHFLISNEIDDLNYLEKEIPEKNQTIQINKNGLRSIEYTWNSEQSFIIRMLYDGGTTEIRFEEITDATKRSIYKYAD